MSLILNEMYELNSTSAQPNLVNGNVLIRFASSVNFPSVNIEKMQYTAVITDNDDGDFIYKPQTILLTVNGGVTFALNDKSFDNTLQVNNVGNFQISIDNQFFNQNIDITKINQAQLLVRFFYRLASNFNNPLLT